MSDVTQYKLSNKLTSSYHPPSSCRARRMLLLFVHLQPLYIVTYVRPCFRQKQMFVLQGILDKILHLRLTNFCSSSGAESISIRHVDNIQFLISHQQLKESIWQWAKAIQIITWRWIRRSWNKTDRSIGEGLLRCQFLVDVAAYTVCTRGSPMYWLVFLPTSWQKSATL